MELPVYVSVVFILNTLLTLFFLFKAAKGAKVFIVVIALWIIFQGIVASTGFYTVFDTKPPHFIFLLFPPLIGIILLFITARGRAFIDTLDTKWLTYLHVVRVPVELVLYWLFVANYVPELMTFEGRNLDILSGLTAPFIAFFLYSGKLNSKVALFWNFACLALLFNIVINAVLSAPSPFQQQAFEQPNVGVFYFPFVWLPCFIVPAVLLSHVVCIRQIIKK
ncbi:MAG: hypothetical protein ACKOXB_15545 [Flavobacteriales bacterium]